MKWYCHHIDIGDVIYLTAMQTDVIVIYIGTSHDSWLTQETVTNQKIAVLIRQAFVANLFWHW